MRFSITEYRGTNITDTPLARLSLVQLKRTLESANELINSSLGWNGDKDALTVINGELRASGIAGVIHLSCGDELEIIPRHFSNSWKESLFFLAIVSRYGNPLLNGYIMSDSQDIHSLFDLCGLVLTKEFISLQRNLVRTYRHHIFKDFSIEGDLIYDSFFDNNDGFLQEVVLFDKANSINAIIQEAMRLVLPYVSIPDVRSQLEVAIAKLGKQPTLLNKRKERVPSRNREWEMLYSLSSDIVAGRSLSLLNGEHSALGFVVDTWRIWQWIVSYGLRSGLDSSKYIVKWQDTSKWGTRTDGARNTTVNVIPDIVVYDRASETPVLILDAKYKELTNQQSVGGVSQSDLYEAFAFCSAKGQDRVILVYPDEVSKDEPGKVISKYTYNLPGVEIQAVKVGIGAITSPQELKQFSKAFASQFNLD